MMTALNMATPRFQKEQRVSFVGGSGTVKGFQPGSGYWTYLVEMEMGPEPVMGRIGSETRILLAETDIALVY